MLLDMSSYLSYFNSSPHISGLAVQRLGRHSNGVRKSRSRPDTPVEGERRVTLAIEDQTDAGLDFHESIMASADFIVLTAALRRRWQQPFWPDRRRECQEFYPERRRFQIEATEGEAYFFRAVSVRSGPA